MTSLCLVFDKFNMFLFDVNYLARSHLNESRTHECNVDNKVLILQLLLLWA